MGERTRQRKVKYNTGGVVMHRSVQGGGEVTKYSSPNTKFNAYDMGGGWREPFAINKKKSAKAVGRQSHDLISKISWEMLRAQQRGDTARFNQLQNRREKVQYANMTVQGYAAMGQGGNG